ncbi:MAG TPA: glycosyl hydrolase, partial [Bacteroidales bacterium]|nr:glycosyl hydrolase [Bacteroidales bacterium]
MGITGEITGRKKKNCFTEVHRGALRGTEVRTNFFLTLWFSVVLCATRCNFSYSQELKWPEVTRETKPWTRMWWMGSIGTSADIDYALNKYSDAGLGGVEITCIYGVKGQEDKFVNYLSPEWMNKFTHILAEANRLGIGVDLANASGWPFGGPWVEPQNACRNINYKTYNLREGERLVEEIRFIQQPLVRPVGQRPDISTLVDPIAKNKNLQLYALDQIRFEKPLKLHSLMAYSDEGKILDLTGRVSPSGTLDWTAPAGDWTLYALFEGWHGKMAERAGPGGEGDVIDHFSAKAIDDFLAHFDEAFRGYDISSLAHGSPGNILDLYAASDIPETEGYELTKLKFASSASDVTGKKLTSCEAATWLGEHF